MAPPAPPGEAVSEAGEPVKLYPSWGAGLTEDTMAQAAAAMAPIGRQLLFVLGAPRSGTTILQNALNSARDVFLLGEPEFDRDAQSPGFAARYNAMQAGLGNLPNKSTYLPPLMGADGAWWLWLAELARHHRLVGAKVVINPRLRDPSLEEFYIFHARLFYDATYVFTFRHPLDMAQSVRGLQEAMGNPQTPWDQLFYHFRTVVRLFVRMHCTLPDVRAVVHEDLDAEAFETLGYELGCDLSDAYGYYSDESVHRADPSVVPAEYAAELAYAVRVYDHLRGILRDGIGRAQLNQNTQNLRPNHLTPLGQLAMMLDPAVLARLGG